jgi:hypothetical protein
MHGRCRRCSPSLRCIASPVGAHPPSSSSSSATGRRSPDRTPRCEPGQLDRAVTRAEGSAVGFVQATVTGDTVDVAWLIGVPWQRRRIAGEAASAVCDWLSTQGVRRLTAHIHPDHVASAKVARRLAMVATGVLETDGEQIWTGQPSPPRTPGEKRRPVTASCTARHLACSADLGPDVRSADRWQLDALHRLLRCTACQSR